MTDPIITLGMKRAMGMPRRHLIDTYSPSDFTSSFDYARFIGQAIGRIGDSNPSESCALTFEPFHALTPVQVEAELNRLAPKGVTGTELHRLGIAPVNVELLQSYLPFGSHWAQQCFDHLKNQKHVLCDPYYCSVLFNDGNKWRQPPVAMDWLVERSAKWPEELVRDYWRNPTSILNEGATLGATFLRDLYDQDQFKDASEGVIPEILIRSHQHLEDVCGSIRALTRSGKKLQIWFRGQTVEHLMPDASRFVSKGFFLHREFRDPVLIPAAYREIDEAYSDPEGMKRFVLEIMQWQDLANDLLGPHMRVLVEEGEFVEHDEIADGGMSSHWSITDEAGNVTESFTKHYVADPDEWRKLLLLQSYGAPTQSVNLTRSPEIACWFATHLQKHKTPNPQYEDHDWAGTPEAEWPLIYVFLLNPEIHPVMDAASFKGRRLLRAERQEAGTLGNSGMLLRNGPARYISLKLRLHPDLGINRTIDEGYLFPPADQDELLAEFQQTVVGLSRFPVLS